MEKNRNRSKIKSVLQSGPSKCTFVDEGFYACVVGNEVANVKAGAYLTVEDPKIVPMNPQSQKPLVFVSYQIVFRYFTQKQWRYEAWQPIDIDI